MYFYTWKDVDRFVQIERTEWEKWATDIEVYVGEVVVCLEDMNNMTKAQAGLRKLFGAKLENDTIYLDMQNKSLKVVY